MRFSTPQGPPPYLNRRDQFRILAMVCMLGFLLIAMQWVAKPSSWYWLTGRPEGTQTTSPRPEIDFGVETDADAALPPDVVRIPNQPADAATEKPAPAIPAISPVETIAEKEPHAADPFAVDPQLLETIRNNTLGIRSSEANAYESLLAKVRGFTLDELERAARSDVDYTVLMLESKNYMGQLLTIEGFVRGLRLLEPTEHSHGINDVYEAWVFTPDSGTNPYCVRFTGKPQLIPVSMEIADPVRVRVTGYFFKRYGYLAQSNLLHPAPLILAKSLREFPPKPIETAQSNLVPYMLAFVLVVGASLSVILWRFRVSDRQFHERHRKRLTEPSAEALDALREIQAADVSDSVQAPSESAESPGS